MEQAARVVSVGARLKKANRRLWRQLEIDAFKGDPYHIVSSIPRGKKNQKRVEFLFLYYGEKAVGRTTVAVDEGWLGEEKNKETGFICDLIVLPEYKHTAGVLIDHGLSVLRAKGVRGVVVKSNNFPALAAQELEDLTLASLPVNPPWHIDLFEQKGFVKHREWVNLRIDLPPAPSQKELAKWDAVLAGQKVTVRRLRTWSRKELKRYSDATCEIMSEHYGYTPRGFMESHALMKVLFFGVFARIGKLRIYLLCDESDDIVGFWAYHPDYSIAMRGISKYAQRKWYDPRTWKALPEFVWNVRRTRRAVIGSMGLRSGWRRKGLARAVDFAFKCVLREGYRQVDTGSMLADNAVVVKMAESFARRYGVSVRRTTYYTLQHLF